MNETYNEIVDSAFTIWMDSWWAEDTEATSLGVIALVFVFLLIGQILKHITNCTGCPFTLLTALAGAGVFFSPMHFSPALAIFESLDAHILMMIFIPPLIFDSAFNSDFYVFKKQLGKIMLLAFPVLAICVGLTAVCCFYGFRLGVYEGATVQAPSWAMCILFGSIVSATDPVAVVTMLKNVGASKRLTTAIEGESLLNDGTAMVIFLIMVEIVEGIEPTWYFMILKFLRLAIGGPIVGWIFGWILTTWLARIQKQPVLEANLTVVMAYLCFFVCEHEYV